MAARGPLLLIVLPLVLSACGGGSSTPVTGDPLGDAVRHTLAQKSAMVALDAKVDLSGQSINASGDGAFAGGTSHVHLNFDVPLLGSSTLDEVVVGKVLWVKSPLIGKKWLRFESGTSAKVAGFDLSALTGVTPTGALALLQHDDNSTSLGKGHYRLDLGGITSGDIQYNSAEAWVDDQNLVRKVKLDFDVNVGSDKAHSIVTINYSNFGTPFTVTVPAASEVAG
jgi:hypothetical protein